MPRPPRFTYAHAVHHVTLRCNNREFLFAEPSLAAFVELLREARASFPLSLYNFKSSRNRGAWHPDEA
jgi:REP element-mobilizing transposase RayT